MLVIGATGDSIIIMILFTNVFENKVWYWHSQFPHSWWRYQMEMFSASLALYAENSPITREFPTQRPVTRSFDVFFDLRLNKRLSIQSWGWWLEIPSRSLWCHCNGNCRFFQTQISTSNWHTFTWMNDMYVSGDSYAKWFWLFALSRYAP